jgi:hypothetical protein
MNFQLPILQPGDIMEDPRHFAETYIEAYEQGRIPPHWPTSTWLGDPGFEDLTARFMTPTMVDSGEEFPARSSPTPSEVQSETEGSSTPSPSEDGSSTEKCPSRSPSPTLSEHLERSTTYNEEDENFILADPDPCAALKAMVRSKRSKRYIANAGQVDQATAEENIEKVYNGFIERADPDEEIDHAEVWADARESFEEALRRHRVKRILDTAKYHLFTAVGAYAKEIAVSENLERDAEVTEALTKILKLEKGKETYDWELEEPRVHLDEWKDMADLVIWEAAEYCWVLKLLDVGVEKEVLEDVKKVLEHVGAVGVGASDAEDIYTITRASLALRDK